MSVLYFFFSSRRRHTRWPRDWSSDVCSSDLGKGKRQRGSVSVAVLEPEGWESALPPRRRTWTFPRATRKTGSRSEERRVGKESRTWRYREHQKRKNTRRCK